MTQQQTPQPRKPAKQLGTFRAKAVDADFGETSTGKPQVAVQFAIIDEGPRANQRVTWYGFFTPDTEARTVESLRYCGCTFGPHGTDITDVTGLDTNEVEVTLEENEYTDDKGKTTITERVGFVNALGGGIRMSKRMDDAGKAKFKDQMAGLLAKTRPAASGHGNGAVPPPAQSKVGGGPAPSGTKAPF